MKQKLLNSLMVVGSMAIVALIMGSKVSSLREANAHLTMELSKANAAAAEAAQAAQPDAGEEERLKQERAELIKLRGEVAALRREKEAWDKRTASERRTAAARPAAPQQSDVDRAQNIADALQKFQTGSTEVKGSQMGALRRKLLNHEKLTDGEQAILDTMSANSAGIEKSPVEFASFQTAFIGSVLGWNNGDPRAAQLQELINRASTVAGERGFDYNSPAQNSPTWSEQQKMLNQRATSAAQAMLTPDERAVFDSAFIGILGVDYGANQIPAK
jgi:hypothetical protein